MFVILFSNKILLYKVVNLDSFIFIIHINLILILFIYFFNNNNKIFNFNKIKNSK